ncbi:glycosyl hydrolase (plasmid) [Streptomyces mirabilis]|uniref:Glycosyl hydrolase n=1 Tax=Streptomyces mirabilis TaxID=68239 RepID=A0ABU3V573_9ACTN|nr:glycosyl hydrolase [Streptomyces mirabilis]MCX5355672.1 glycoside hydrolase family protein [Streptomyces mirabilis]MDU9001317.1 glycosyl hydrolase [Streptomyces mirabilis]
MKKQLDVSRLVVQALEATPRCAGLADITANGTEHRVRCGASGSRGVCVTARPARGRAGACSHRPSAGRPATARVDPAWVGATVAGQAWPAATAPAGTAPTAPVAAGRRDGTARGQQHRTGGGRHPLHRPPTVRGVGHSLWTGGAVAAVAACALVASYLTTDHSAPVARTAPPSPCGGAPAPSSPRQHDPPPSPHPRSGPRRPPPGPGPTPPAAPAAPASSARKGAGVWDFDGASQAVAASGASWYYTWSTGHPAITTPSSASFVPMAWGPAPRWPRLGRTGPTCSA